MKKILSLLALLLLSTFIMGMGDLGGKPEGSIPMPDKDYKASFTDVNAVTTSLSFVSINGKDFVKGKRGSASVTVPFENIKSVKITLLGDDRDVDADLDLLDGSSVKLKIDGKADLSGKADFGTVKIKIREVTKIEFSSK